MNTPLRKAAKGEINNNLVKQPMLPDTINFFSTSDDRTEVMRITRNGVFVNPEIKPDDAAKTVLNAIDSQIKMLVQRAVEDEREACAMVCESMPTPKHATTLTHAPTLETCAAAIRARGEK